MKCDSPLIYDSVSETFLMEDLPASQQLRRVEATILRTLSPEHISHLKYIYSMSDETNEGFVPLASISSMLKRCQSHISISIYDSLKLFELIQRDQNVQEEKLI